MLMRIWYPITVASKSYLVKDIIYAYLLMSSDDALIELPFKLHDFGARGVSSGESAAIGGLAHLVNFQGSDTVEALQLGRIVYNKEMPGISIPAAEHSTICSWGKENEKEAYKNMIKQFGNNGSMFAVVSDSYDIYNAVENIWGKELKEMVIKSGSTVVIRPDSGKPEEVVLKVIQLLDKTYGSIINSKGYKVLNNVRVLQGDGMNISSINCVMHTLRINGFSISNIAFGMGGGLLQDCNRDTLGFAMKCSYIEVDGKGRDVFKEPITDPGKNSKKGRQNTDKVRTVFQDGFMVLEEDLETIRKRVDLNSFN